MFSERFLNWCNGICSGNSIGNGSAMRVSPIGFLYNDLDDVLSEAEKSAVPSHNSIEGIKGAKAIASSIFLLKNGASKNKLKNYIENEFSYNLNLDLNFLQQNNLFNGTCKTTVPQAIFIFLISNSFDDALRKAISIGGDTDTIACMVGALSEAYYGINEAIINEVDRRIPSEFVKILKKSYKMKDK